MSTKRKKDVMLESLLYFNFSLQIQRHEFTSTEIDAAVSSWLQTVCFVRDKKNYCSLEYSVILKRLEIAFNNLWTKCVKTVIYAYNPDAATISIIFVILFSSLFVTVCKNLGQHFTIVISIFFSRRSNLFHYTDRIICCAFTW